MNLAGLEGRWALRWGVKESFARYVSSLPDGGMRALGEAHLHPEGGWLFAAAGSDSSPEQVILRFAGEVRFSGHGGMLVVIMMDPALTITPDGVALSVVDLTAWPDTSQREVIARGPVPTRQGDAWLCPLALESGATEHFNNVYPPGTPLDAVVLVPAAD